MSSPLHPGEGGDNKSISHSEANDAPESTLVVDFDTPDRPFDIFNFPTTPPTHLYLPTGSSHGCDKSLTSDSDIRHHQTLQPHDSIRGNTKRKKKELTTIYSQNSQGLWHCPRGAEGNILVDHPPDLLKLEYIVDFMRQHDVVAWLLQETWKEGDEFDVNIGGYHIFRHNALHGKNGRQHLFKGVAIIHSPTFYQAWRAAGSLSPITTDPDYEEFFGRIICLNLKFTSFDNRGKCIKGKDISIVLMSVYFPCNDRQHERFCKVFDSVLADINLNTQVIVGSDINACIGTRTSGEHKQVLGPYGIARSNTRGENLVHILGSNDMRVENTFFNHTPEDYVTYTSIPTNFHPAGISNMHDIFACSQSLHKRIHDCKAVPRGAVSDHKAVRLSLMLTSIKFRGHALSRGTIDWPKILSDEHTRAMYNEHLLMLMTGPTQWDDHQELILQAGAFTATTHKCQCEGWFQMSCSTLAPLYTKRNTLKHAIKHASHLPSAIQATMQIDLNHLTHHISHSVSHAKATWYADICQKIHDMRFNSTHA